MAATARHADPLLPNPVAAPAGSWSGGVHGPVAAMHATIEARLAGGPSLPAPGPVDRLLALASRATGWTVLLVAAIAVLALF